MAAISAHHNPVEGKSLGKHNLVVRFLSGARRLNPPRPPSLPSWDLALVLKALLTAPFEPFQSVELKFLSMKTLLLTALASIKRVGDLQAFSVDDSCLEFGPADSSATLRPRPGYVPKVPTTPYQWCSGGYTQVYGVYPLLYQLALRIPTPKSLLMRNIQLCHALAKIMTVHHKNS